MSFFDFFKNKKSNDEDNIDIKWLDHLFKICGDEQGTHISTFYNLIFLQLKTNVFTLLAPVNLKDEEKMKKFYTHNFSLGYVYGLIFTFLQSSSISENNEEKVHELLTVAMMKQLFNFTDMQANGIFIDARTTLSKDQIFMKGVRAGGDDWILFYKEDCKGMIGLHFDKSLDIIKKDLD